MDAKGTKGRGNGGGNHGGTRPGGGGKGGTGGAQLNNKGKQKPKAGTVSAATASKKVTGAKKTVGGMTPTVAAITAAAAKAANKANQNVSKAKNQAKKKVGVEDAAVGANKTGKKQIIVKVKPGPGGKKVIITTTNKVAGTQGQAAKAKKQVNKKKNEHITSTAAEQPSLQGKKILEQKKQSSPKKPLHKKIKRKEDPPQSIVQQNQQRQQTTVSKLPVTATGATSTSTAGANKATSATGTAASSNTTSSPEKIRHSARIATKRALSIDQTTSLSDLSAPAAKKKIISLKKNTTVTDTSSSSTCTTTRAISAPEITKVGEKSPKRNTRSQAKMTADLKAPTVSSMQQKNSPNKKDIKPLNTAKKADQKMDVIIQEKHSKPVAKSAQDNKTENTNTHDESTSTVIQNEVNSSKVPCEEEKEKKTEEIVRREKQTPMKKEAKTPMKTETTASTKDEDLYVTPEKVQQTIENLQNESMDHIAKAPELGSPCVEKTVNTTTITDATDESESVPSLSITTPSKPETPLRVEALKNAWGPSFGTPVSTPSPNKPSTPLSSWFFSNGPVNFIQRISFPPGSGGIEDSGPESEKEIAASATVDSRSTIDSTGTDTIKYKQTAFLSNLAKSDWRAWYGKVDNLEDILDPPLAHSIEKVFFPTGHMIKQSKQGEEKQEELETLSTKEALDLFESQIQEQKKHSLSMGSFLLSVLHGKTITGKDLTEEYAELLKGTSNLD